MANILTPSPATPGQAVEPVSRERGEIASAAVAKKASFGIRQVIDWLAPKMSFWTVVPIIGLVGFVYLYAFTDSLYQSQTIVTLQNSSSASSSLSSLGSSLLGSVGGSTQSGAVVAYIQSPDLMHLLDKKFNLRRIYSAPGHSPFWRLDPDASDEDFLTFYQQMITVTQDTTTLLITVNVLDYDATRAQAICRAIVLASQNYVNGMSAVMSNATLKYAQAQLVAATKAVETAQPYERAVAEMQLTASQQALVAAQGLANQQQSFLVSVAIPNFPTDTSDPDRLVDEASILLAASAFYLMAHLLLANVRDHRRA